MNVPANICNWIVSILSDRSHCTIFQSTCSFFKSINASVVQGSAIGPTTFAIVSSDLKPICESNSMIKYADDTYLIIPSSNSQMIKLEINNIADWAKLNNLKLNKNKSKEILFYKPRTNSNLSPPEIEGVERVSELRCLGVTLTSNFSFTAHISQIISSSSRNLFALYTLRSHGLSNDLLDTVFKSTTLSKLLYASQSWWGYLNAHGKERLEAYLRRAARAGFYKNSKSFEELFSAADIKTL